MVGARFGEHEAAGCSKSAVQRYARGLQAGFVCSDEKSTFQARAAPIRRCSLAQDDPFARAGWRRPHSSAPSFTARAHANFTIDKGCNDRIEAHSKGRTLERFRALVLERELAVAPAHRSDELGADGLIVVVERCAGSESVGGN